MRDVLAYSALPSTCRTIHIRLSFKPFKLENHGFDPIRAACYEGVFINHPWAELGPQHHGHDDFLQILPCPAATETIGPLIQLLHHKSIAFGEFVTRPVMQFRFAIGL